MAQVNEFSTFLRMGRCKSLGSLKSFLCYAPQLSGASVLFLLILSPPQGAQLGMAAMAEGLAVGSLAARKPFVTMLSSRRAHHRGSCSGLMAETSFVY